MSWHLTTIWLELPILSPMRSQCKKEEAIIRMQNNINQRQRERKNLTRGQINGLVQSWKKEGTAELNNVNGSQEYSGEGRRVIVQICNQEMPSWRWIQRLYSNKQKSQNKFSRKIPKKNKIKASRVLDLDSLDRWNQDQLVSEWREEKSLEKDGNNSRSSTIKCWPWWR